MSTQTPDQTRRGVIPRVGPQPGDPERAALRARNEVSLVAAHLEGTGLDAQPGGTYGFTYAPALPNAPLFQAHTYRSFEIHKRIDGDSFVLGFVAGAVADQVAAGGELDLHVYPEAEGAHDTFVAIPAERIRRHQQHTVHIEPGLFLKLAAD